MMDVHADPAAMRIVPECGTNDSVWRMADSLRAGRCSSTCRYKEREMVTLSVVSDRTLKYSSAPRINLRSIQVLLIVGDVVSEWSLRVAFLIVLIQWARNNLPLCKSSSAEIHHKVSKIDLDSDALWAMKLTREHCTFWCNVVGLWMRVWQLKG